MNQLNTEVTKNNTSAKGLGISLSSFRKAVFNFAQQCLQSRKSIWTRQLLLELANKPAIFRSINDLGSSTGLNSAVYPILASLHRQDLVEARQIKDIKGTTLTYRLTEKGFFAV